MVQSAIAPKALAEKVKLLNRVKEQKKKNQSLTMRQLAALGVVSKKWQKMRQGWVSHMMRWCFASVIWEESVYTGKESDVENAINE